MLCLYYTGIVVGLEETRYTTTEGDLSAIAVCVALMNGTISGDEASIVFVMTSHNTPTNTALNCKNTDSDALVIEFQVKVNFSPLLC